MKADPVFHSGDMQISTEMLRELASMRFEGEQPIEPSLTPAQVREIARMGAVHVVDVVRNLEEHARTWSADEREAWEARITALGNEFSEAVVSLRRLRVENTPPLFLTAQVPPPIRPPRPFPNVVPMPRIRRAGA